MPSPFSALLLAAGRSTRMGCDKALLEIDGVPLWSRQRDTLARAGAAEILLSARPEQKWVQHTSGFSALLHDEQPNCGPIIGVTAGLERAVHPHLAVLAIDLPRVDAAWFQSLLADCAPDVGVVGRRGEFFVPLAAIYPREVKWLAWETIARGDFSLQHFLAAAVAQGFMRVREISAADAVRFENWNEPPCA